MGNADGLAFGSVCSGIEAASVAWAPLGWRAAWFAEIEPFPAAVLAHHYPDTPNMGDMAALPDKIRAGHIIAPDILCGGTPCQAFSVAGKRESLADARGNLSLTFCDIADAIDDARSVLRQPPGIVFWENVPGVLSTHDNAFGCFLAHLCGGDIPLDAPNGWTDAGCVSGPRRTAAWRTLDAQYFGLAQRRRRVFVVASARADCDPAAVLFEFEGVRRDTPPRREKGQDASAIPARSLGGGGLGTDFDCDGGLIRAASTGDISHCLNAGGMGRQDYETETLVTHSLRGEGFDAQAFDWQSGGDSRGLDPKPTAQLQRCQVPAVLEPVTYDVFNVTAPVNRQSRTPGDPCHTLARSQVRRITPEECEALQGFPRGYTAIPWRNKPADQCPDGPRYKALGNSWAVPVVRWIGERIAAHV